MVREAPDEAYKLKKKKNNGLMYTLFWHLSYGCVEIFKFLKIGPNTVTVLGLLYCIFAGVFFLAGTYSGNILGAACFIVAILMDCTDGKLARAYKTSSDIGIWLDYNFDAFRQFFVYPPILFAIYQETHDPSVFIYGFVIITMTAALIIVTERFMAFPYGQDSKNTITKTKLHFLVKELYGYEIWEPVLLLVFALANNVFLFVKIWTVFITVFYLGTAVVLGTSVFAEDKKKAAQGT